MEVRVLFWAPSFHFSTSDLVENTEENASFPVFFDRWRPLPSKDSQLKCRYKCQYTSHGFRATASTLLNASNLSSIDTIEHSLAHQDRDAVRRAYARGDAMAERRKMAQWRAGHRDMLRDGSASNVIAMLPFKPSA